jgi:hypothetical protein
VLSYGGGEKKVILSYILFAAIGVLIFFATYKMPVSLRIILAIGVFLLLSIAITFIVVSGGDPAPKDSRPFTQKDLKNAAK